MSFERPTLSEIINRNLTQFKTRLGLPEIPRKTILFVLAHVLGGAIHLLYGYIEQISKRLLMNTATGENLDYWAYVFGIKRNCATCAQGQVIIQGQPNTTLEQNTVLVRTDGISYRVITTVSLSGTETRVPVEAQATGRAGNCPDGTHLQLQNPPPGVAEPIKTDGITGGTDEETDEALRLRIITHLRNLRRSGSKSDYELWVGAVEQVGRVFILEDAYPSIPASIGITFLTQDPAHPLPSPELKSKVQGVVDEYRPAGAKAQAFILAPWKFNLAIKTPQTGQDEQELRRRLGEFIFTEFHPKRPLKRSKLVELIRESIGATEFEMIEPHCDIEAPSFHYPIIGEIKWIR